MDGIESFFLTQRYAKVSAKLRKEECGFLGGGTGFEPVTNGTTIILNASVFSDKLLIQEYWLSPVHCSTKLSYPPHEKLIRIRGLED
jgi:hypothetical protein